MLQSSPSEMLACILATPLGLFVVLLSFKRRLLTAYLVNYITLKFRFSMVEHTCINQTEWNLNNRIQLGIFVFTRKPHMKKDTVCKWNFMDVHQRKVNVFFAVHYTYICSHTLFTLATQLAKRHLQDVLKMSFQDKKDILPRHRTDVQKMSYCRWLTGVLSKNVL